MHLNILKKQNDIDHNKQIIETLDNENGNLLDAIICSNKMIGEKLNNCIVSSNSEKFLLSNLLSRETNYIFRFSNTNCSDCLKQQIDFLYAINKSNNYLLITKFGNNRLIEIFGKQLKERELYNISSKDKLFENEDDNRPFVAVVNKNLQILAIYYCDETFKKYHQFFIS